MLKNSRFKIINNLIVIVRFVMNEYEDDILEIMYDEMEDDEIDDAVEM